MYAIPSYDALSVAVIGDGGSSRHFPSLKAAIADLGWCWVRFNAGPALGAPNYANSWGCSPYHYTFCFRGEFGTVLTLDEISSACTTALPSYARDFRAAPKGYPVPHTGRLRGGRIWRHPRTLSAKRAACAVLNDEMEPPIRPSRRANRLPSAWDDRRIAACGIKNWKRFRKTQYRSAGGPQ